MRHSCPSELHFSDQSKFIATKASRVSVARSPYLHRFQVSHSSSSSHPLIGLVVAQGSASGKPLPKHNMAITLHVFDDSIQGTIFVLIIVLTPLSILATGLRFLATRASSRNLGAEDWFALGALFFFLGWVIIALLSTDPNPNQSRLVQEADSGSVVHA